MLYNKFLLFIFHLSHFALYATLHYWFNKIHPLCVFRIVASPLPSLPSFFLILSQMKQINVGLGDKTGILSSISVTLHYLLLCHN